MKLLGYSFSHPSGFTKFSHGVRFVGITAPNLFIFQPQEVIIISNIVEEAYYAQSRSTILRIVPIPNQQYVTGYNYVQFEQHDDIGIKLDRIDDIEIKILTRKEDFVDFVDECTSNKEEEMYARAYKHCKQRLKEVEMRREIYRELVMRIKEEECQEDEGYYEV